MSLVPPSLVFVLYVHGHCQHTPTMSQTVTGSFLSAVLAIVLVAVIVANRVSYFGLCPYLSTFVFHYPFLVSVILYSMIASSFLFSSLSFLCHRPCPQRLMSLACSCFIYPIHLLSVSCSGSFIYPCLSSCLRLSLPLLPFCLLSCPLCCLHPVKDINSVRCIHLFTLICLFVSVFVSVFITSFVPIFVSEAVFVFV